jgi:hypothetical protein
MMRKGCLVCASWTLAYHSWIYGTYGTYGTRMLGIKGPKHEILGSGVFMKSKPVLVGGLGTRQKI